MAIIWRIKQGILPGPPPAWDYICPSPTEGTMRGVVRLWYEQSGAPGVPDHPSDKFLVIGDDIGPVSGPMNLRYGDPVTGGDLHRMGGWQDLLTARGLSIEAYNAQRGFYMDLALPAAMIDSYTG